MATNASENKNPWFDPYHLWLGIPPEEQPPNHYRLLGIAPLEKNADVIATAADRQMSHLRTFQSGMYSALSQDLLNEVAAARLCLLDPVKKAAYDTQLRQQTGPVEKETRDSASWPIVVKESRSFRGQAGTKTHWTNVGLHVATLVTGSLMLLGIWAWNATDRHNPPIGGRIQEKPKVRYQPLQRPTASVRLPTTPTPPSPAKIEHQPTFSSSVSEKPLAAELLPLAETPPLNRTEVSVQPSALETTPLPRAKASIEKPAHAERSPAKRAEKGKAAGKIAESKQPLEIKRLPVPTGVTQETIATRLAAFPSSSRSRTQSEQIKAANQILRLSDTSKSSPSEQYLLLRCSYELALQAGDVVLAFQIIEATAARFDIDVVGEKAQTLLALARTATNADQIRTLYGSSRQVTAQALFEGRHELACALADSVLRACQRPKGKEFRKRAIDQRAWVQEYCRRHDLCQQAEATLQTDSTNARSHLTLGRHYCFFLNNWEKGLPHLAQGEDAVLRQLAQRELAPSTEALDLADAWWDLGQSYRGEEKDSFLLRAATWYERARANIPPGLLRLKVDKRLEELTEIRQRHPPHYPLQLNGTETGLEIGPVGWLDSAMAD